MNEAQCPQFVHTWSWNRNPPPLSPVPIDWATANISYCVITIADQNKSTASYSSSAEWFSSAQILHINNVEILFCFRDCSLKTPHYSKGSCGSDVKKMPPARRDPSLTHMDVPSSSEALCQRTQHEGGEGGWVRVWVVACQLLWWAHPVPLVLLTIYNHFKSGMAGSVIVTSVTAK